MADEQDDSQKLPDSSQAEEEQSISSAAEDNDSPESSDSSQAEEEQSASDENISDSPKPDSSQAEDNDKQSTTSTQVEKETTSSASISHRPSQDSIPSYNTTSRQMFEVSQEVNSKEDDNERQTGVDVTPASQMQPPTISVEDSTLNGKMASGDPEIVAATDSEQKKEEAEAIQAENPPNEYVEGEYLKCKYLATQCAGHENLCSTNMNEDSKGVRKKGKRIYFKKTNRKISAVILMSKIEKDEKTKAGQDPKITYRSLEHYIKSGNSKDVARDGGKFGRHVKWFLGNYVPTKPTENVSQDGNTDQIKENELNAPTVWLEILKIGCKRANPTVVKEALKYFSEALLNKGTKKLAFSMYVEENIDMEGWICHMLESCGHQYGFKGSESPQVDNLLEAIHLMHCFQHCVVNSESKQSTKEMSLVAILAAKTSNFRVFQYAMCHFVLKQCSSESRGQGPKNTDDSDSHLLPSLRQVNDQGRNTLHTVLALPDLCVAHKMLSEIDRLTSAKEQLSKLLAMQDVFKKTPMHYLFDRSWPQKVDTGGKTHRKLMKIVEILVSWDVSQETLSMDDSEDLNILFTLLKNHGHEYIDSVKALCESNDNAYRLLRGNNRNGGFDIAHVFAAYGDLTQLEKVVNDFCGFSPVWQQHPPQALGSAAQLESEFDAGVINDVLVGWSVIHFACMNGMGQNIKFLLSQGYRLNELTPYDGWNGIDLSVFYNNSEAVQKAYKEWWNEKKNIEKNRWWLSSYLTMLDPVSRALWDDPLQIRTHESRQSADRFLAGRKHWFEEWQRMVSWLINTDSKQGHDEYAHFISCVLQPERVETYLYQCLESDSPRLYDNLINSTFWNAATATQSVDDIECSTVRFILEKRAFDRAYKIAQEHKQPKSPPDSSNKESQDNYDETEAMCSCCYPENSTNYAARCCCCWPKNLKCCKKDSKRKSGASELLKYLNNGREFLSNLKLPCEEFKKYSLLGLALLTGRTEMVKCMLITRQTDLIPSALQTIIQADYMIDKEKSNPTMAKENEFLRDAKDFAYKVLMNALDTLYTGTTANQAELIVHYLLGELAMPDPKEEAAENSNDRKVPLRKYTRPIFLHNDETARCKSSSQPETKSDANKKEKIEKDRYQKGMVLDSTSLEQGVGTYRQSTVDFYVLSRNAEADFEEGPLFQHHLRRGARMYASDDRRSMKCCILRQKELPLYNIVDLAEKANINEIFATDCFKLVSNTLWNRSIVASRKKSQRKYSCPEKALTPRYMIFYYTIFHLLYLAFLMKHLLTDSIFFGWEHVVISVYVVAFVVQEVTEIFKHFNKIGHSMKDYFSDPWNWFDALTVFFTVAGLIMTGVIHVNLASTSLTDAQKAYYLNDESRLLTVFNAKMVLGFGFLCSFLKLLHVLRFLQSTGPSLTIFYYVLVRDLFPFAIIVAILILAFGTYFYAMLTFGRHYFSSNDTYQSQRELMSLLEIFSRPLLDAFGELDLSSLQRCRDSLLDGDSADLCYFQHGVNIYTYCGLLFFVILVNLIMLNMLIARFSLTIDTLDKMSEAIWRRSRQRLLLDFRSHWTLPPPLNLLYLILSMFIYPCLRLRRSRRVRPKDNREQRDDAEDFAMQNNLEDYLLLQGDRFRNCRAGFYQTDVESYHDISNNVNAGVGSKNETSINMEGRA